MSSKYRVGLTRDFLSEDGRLAFKDIGLGLLDADPDVSYEFFDQHHAEVTPEQVARYDGIISYIPRYTAKTLAGVDRLAVLARFGVGYDMIDVDACTENNVILAITPEGVRIPIAEGQVTLILALAKEIFTKSRVVREGRWMDHKFIVGSCLNDKTLGSVGLGNIGGHMMRLLAPFDLGRRFAFDPYCSKENADALGVELVDLDTLLSESDFVCINCMLNDETRKLIGQRELGLMKSSAYLINTARGPIVDQKALTEALRTEKIRGAALDVVEVEPIEPDDPLLELNNVIILPHGIGWTEECLLGNGRGACEAVLNVLHGKLPAHVVNTDVVDRPGMREKLARYGG